MKNKKILEHATDPFLRLVGGTCREIRKQANLKQEDMAKTANLSTRTISRFENGEANNMQAFETYMKLYHEQARRSL